MLCPAACEPKCYNKGLSVYKIQQTSQTAAFYQCFISVNIVLRDFHPLFHTSLCRQRQTCVTYPEARAQLQVQLVCQVLPLSLVIKLTAQSVPTTKLNSR
jgi:hypothetical protein